jgi:predicted aldo/keto reductase-like oxidoreductase
MIRSLIYTSPVGNGPGKEVELKTQRRFNRREFLGRTLAGAGLWGLGRVPDARRRLPGGRRSGVPAASLIRRTLGRTGLRVPVVSMGVMNSLLPELVLKAYDLGIRHFDTAASYQRGRNEEMVGRAIKQIGDRDSLVIATKIMTPQHREETPASKSKAVYLELLEASLKRLQLDSVDIVYVHDVGHIDEVSSPGLLEGMAEAKKRGQARTVGFSTHRNMQACLEGAVRLGGFDVILTAYNYSLASDTGLRAAMTRAADSGIGLVAMKTQCQQDWYRDMVPAELQAYYQGTIRHPALLKWVLHHDCLATAVPGFTSFDQLEADVACASDLALTPEEKKFLEDRHVRTALASNCRQCGSCRTTCPRGADIPGLMRLHMYAFSYGNPFQARETLEAPSVRAGLEACADCGSCRAACSGRVPIARRIDQLKALYA